MDATTFLDEVDTLVLAGDARMLLLGSAPEIAPHLAAAAERSTRVWNMQNVMSARSLREAQPLNELSHRRGADLRLVVPAQVLRRTPLLTSYSVRLRTPSVPDPLRVAPVPRPMILVDDAVFVAGPLGTRLAHTAWRTTDPGLVDRARQAYLAVWDTALPADEAGGRPPLPDRTAEVAMRLIDGASDREIAADLGVSERTVSAEVRTVVDWLGARSRGHAIAMLVDGSH